jgi:hypothetical protein
MSSFDVKAGDIELIQYGSGTNRKISYNRYTSSAEEKARINLGTYSGTSYPQATLSRPVDEKTISLLPKAYTNALSLGVQIIDIKNPSQITTFGTTRTGSAYGDNTYATQYSSNTPHISGKSGRFYHVKQQISIEQAITVFKIHKKNSSDPADVEFPSIVSENDYLYLEIDFKTPSNTEDPLPDGFIKFLVMTDPDAHRKINGVFLRVYGNTYRDNAHNGFLVGGGLSPYVQLSSAGQSIMFIQMGKGLVQKNQGTWFFPIGGINAAGVELQADNVEEGLVTSVDSTGLIIELSSNANTTANFYSSNDYVIAINGESKSITAHTVTTVVNNGVTSYRVFITVGSTFTTTPRTGDEYMLAQ